MATHHIVTIVGSLRKESFSLKIANALAKLAPPSLKLDVTTLHGISFFNQDLEAAPPADWLAFRDKRSLTARQLCQERQFHPLHRRLNAPQGVSAHRHLVHGKDQSENLLLALAF